METKGPCGISKETAVEIAKQTCLAEGWPWNEPISVWGGFLGWGRHWAVRTNAHSRGCNATVVILKSTGEVQLKAFAPR
jgi:hypothetical protein